MTSNKGSPAAASGDSEPTSDEPQNGEQASLGDRIAQAGREKSAQVADQAKAKAHDLTEKARTAASEEPKRSWAAVSATVAAGAGVVAGWVVKRRRNRARRPWWSRLRRPR